MLKFNLFCCCVDGPSTFEFITQQDGKNKNKYYYFVFSEEIQLKTSH
jgi:hypothetical protein